MRGKRPNRRHRAAEQCYELASPHACSPQPEVAPYHAFAGNAALCITVNLARRVRLGSITSFPPSRRVRFAPRADIRPMPAFMSTSARTARSQTFRFFRLWLWLGCCTARQTHREHRALARLARHGHVAAHHAGELAGDGEPEPRPAVAARCQGIGLGEILKQFFLLL